MRLGGERALAAAAHLAVLVGMAGLLVSVSLYLYTRRRRMPFAADQAGQAILYQAALGAFMIVLTGLGAQGFLDGVPVGAVRLIAMAYGAYGAFAALDGRYFRYVRGR